jgi:hypothetical protein
VPTITASSTRRSRRTEKIKPDGSYEVTTLIGKYIISLSEPAVSENPKLRYFSKSFDVKDGSNDLDIVVP